MSSTTTRTSGTVVEMESMGGPVKILNLTHPRADKFTDVLTDVEELISAKYQKKDVTAILKKPNGLYNPETHTLNLKGENLDSIFKYGLTPLSKFCYSERKLELIYRTTTQQVQLESLQEQASTLNNRLKNAEQSLEEAEKRETEKATEESAGKCCICLEEDAQYLMLPCSHLCLCADCKVTLSKASGRGQEKCPVCRHQVTQTLRVFTA